MAAFTLPGTPGSLGNSLSSGIENGVQTAVLDLPSWVTDAKRWMQPTLGNIVLPGVVYLHECGIGLRNQKSKSSGNDYGNILIQGLEIPEFTFEILLFTKKDEDAWENISQLYLPRKRPNERNILPVYHPMLALYQITSCLVLSLRSRMPNAGGPMGIVIGCVAVSPINANATKTLTSKGLGGIGPGGNYKSPDVVQVNANIPSVSESGRPVRRPVPNL